MSLDLWPLGLQVLGRHDLESVREPGDDPLHTSEHRLPVGEVLIRKRDRQDRLWTVPPRGQRDARSDGGRADAELSGEVMPEQLQRGWSWPERRPPHLELKLITFLSLVKCPSEVC